MNVFFTTLRFSGAKTQEFLQGQLTCDMQLLEKHGDYSFAACCDHRGRMVANFWVVKWQEDFLFIVPASMMTIVRDHLQKYAVFSKVVITEDNRFFITENSATTGGIIVTLPNQNRQLVIDEDAMNRASTDDPFDSHWKQRNIEDHLCLLCPATSLLFTPYMIGLEKQGGVSFTKGCYVGQEIVARTEHLGTVKRHLTRLTLKSDHALKPGDEIPEGVIVEVFLMAENKYDVLAVVR